MTVDVNNYFGDYNVPGINYLGVEGIYRIQNLEEFIGNMFQYLRNHPDFGDDFNLEHPALDNFIELYENRVTLFAKEVAVMRSENSLKDTLREKLLELTGYNDLLRLLVEKELKFDLSA